MDVPGEFGMDCQPWPLVGVLVTGPPDLTRDRFAAGDILELFKGEGIGATPYVATPAIPPCSLFSTLTGKPSTTRTKLAKIAIIIGKKPIPILK
jgi:hypothetical protein